MSVFGELTTGARLFLAGLACFVASVAVAEVVRRVALRRALLDHVNERSLHTVPTPRLGGVAIVMVTLVAGVLGRDERSSEDLVLLAVCGGVALVGLRDDLKPMSAAARIAIQIAVSTAFLHFVGTPPLLIARGLALSLPPVVVSGLLVVWMVGVLNIYNFMDGMDGLAGFQTVTAAAALGVMLGGTLSGYALALGAAAAGFLVHNFPPARIFMGDAGSTFIGMSFAALAVVGMHHAVPITESALVLAPFLLDGTFTILRRALRGEKVWKAHRTHLYQRAVQTGLAHREVLLVYVVWLSIAAAGAVLASRSAAALGLGWAAAVVGLLVVWRWVVRRESDRAELT